MLSALRHKGSRLAGQAGLTLVELMVSIAISMTVLSGVVQVLVVSKSNFVTERELSGLQENARFAVKYLGDQIRMAGFSSCNKAAVPNFGNGLRGATGIWYLANLGLTGYEYDEGIGTFPADFSAAVAEDTDAIVVRRAEDVDLRISGAHNMGTATMPLNNTHPYKPGQPFVVVSADCQQVSVFQSTGPANAANDATTIRHEAGGGISPGNCNGQVRGNFFCNAAGVITGGSNGNIFLSGSRVMLLRSEAHYVGASTTDATVPALFRERMYLDESSSTIDTIAEELVQGVENMQILYGVDTDGNGTANIYETAEDVADWDSVVTVRLMLRMRSVNPVYNQDVDYPEFEGVADTDGSDRFMRQTVSTTIRIRNA